jgi:Domain of unknown function (DUF4129)
VRSHTDGPRALALAILLTASVIPEASAIQRRSASTNSERLQPAEIARAMETVKADPNLATERTVKMLRWQASTAAKRSRMPAWLTWIAGLFLMLDQSARILVWCAATGLAGLLVVFILRLARAYGVSHREEQFVAPTHVRDLDIRPESLPEDIGASARVLWDRGEHRTSLALLYRGMLSRLAHVHRIPIRDSSTEGDCVSLAAAYVIHERREYVSRLVRVWQRSVYGHEPVGAATVYALCDGFALALDPGSRSESIAIGGAA